MGALLPGTPTGIDVDIKVDTTADHMKQRNFTNNGNRAHGF